MYEQKEFKGKRYDEIKNIPNTGIELLLEEKLAFMKKNNILPGGHYYVDVQTPHPHLQSIGKKVSVFFHPEDQDEESLRSFNKNTTDLLMNAFNEFELCINDPPMTYNHLYIDLIPSLPTHINFNRIYRMTESPKDKLEIIRHEIQSPYNEDCRRIYSEFPDNIDIISNYLEGISFNIKDKELYGKACETLVEALLNNKYEIVKLLIRKGININNKLLYSTGNEREGTLIHELCSQNIAYPLGFLESIGADINSINHSSGLTPLDIVYSNPLHSEEICEFLTRRNALATKEKLDFKNLSYPRDQAIPF